MNAVKQWKEENETFRRTMLKAERQWREEIERFRLCLEGSKEVRSWY